MHHDLTLFGWRVRSELDLPELLSWAGDDREPDLIITRNDKLSAEKHHVSRLRLSTLTSVCDTGEWILEIPSVGCIEVRNGNEIRVLACATATDLDLKAFVLGPALAIYCCQRRLLPMRATIVAHSLGAIAICGDPGVGKSAVAFALSLRGFKLVSDGLGVINASHESIGVAVVGSYPWFQLWRRAAFSLNLSLDTMIKVRPCLEKYMYKYAGPFEPSYLGFLQHIVILRRERDHTQAINGSLSAEQFVTELRRHVAFDQHYHRGLPPAELTAALREVASSVKMHTISMLDDDFETARLVEALAE
jgi:hypothetical protein